MISGSGVADWEETSDHLGELLVATKVAPGVPYRLPLRLGLLPRWSSRPGSGIPHGRRLSVVVLAMLVLTIHKQR